MLAPVLLPSLRPLLPSLASAMWTACRPALRVARAATVTGIGRYLCPLAAVSRTDTATAAAADDDNGGHEGAESADEAKFGAVGS